MKSTQPIPFSASFVRLASLSFGLVILASGCVSRQLYDEMGRELDAHKEVLASLRASQRSLEEENKDLREQIADMGGESTRAKVLAAEAAAQKKRFEEEVAKLRGLLEKTGPIGRASGQDFEVISTPQGGTGVRIGGSLLFGLGKADLTPAGEKLLHSLADELRAQSSIGLKVVGHTDDTRFAKEITKQTYPFGNLQLSAMRAIVVADFLQHQCGIAGSRIWIAAHGKYNPVVPNDSAEHKARNRRVEIHFIEMK